MKTEITEFDDGFTIDLTAETVEECALLARTSINQKKRSIEYSVWAGRDGDFIASIDIKKKIITTGSIA